MTSRSLLTKYPRCASRKLKDRWIIKTIFHRPNRDNGLSFWTSLARNLDGTVLENWEIRKNAFDIMTMMAVVNRKAYG